MEIQYGVFSINSYAFLPMSEPTAEFSVLGFKN